MQDYKSAKPQTHLETGTTVEGVTYGSQKSDELSGQVPGAAVEGSVQQQRRVVLSHRGDLKVLQQE